MQSPLHREITLLMTKIRRLASTAVNKRLSLVGTSMHEYRVLFRLAHDERVPQHELAFDAAMDRAAASRLLRDMTQTGLVTVEVDSADKRQRMVRLTHKGRTLERTLSPIVDEALSPYMGGLTAAEDRQFLALLRKACAACVAAARAEEEAEQTKTKSIAPRPAAMRPTTTKSKVVKRAQGTSRKSASR
jgi:DNA-binding MarR family transcriptional regulator